MLIVWFVCGFWVCTLTFLSRTGELVLASILSRSHILRGNRTESFSPRVTRMSLRVTCPLKMSGRHVGSWTSFTADSLKNGNWSHTGAASPLTSADDVDDDELDAAFVDTASRESSKFDTRAISFTRGQLWLPGRPINSLCLCLQVHFICTPAMFVY